MGLGERSNAVGLMLMPTFDITRKLQIVGRYELASSDKNRGLSGQRRYENLAPGAGPGNLYNAAYLGLNYYIHGHKLKLMAGMEYANMRGPRGFEGVTYLAGVRVFW